VKSNSTTIWHTVLSNRDDVTHARLEAVGLVKPRNPGDARHWVRSSTLTLRASRHRIRHGLSRYLVGTDQYLTAPKTRIARMYRAIPMSLDACLIIKYPRQDSNL
jgi:hypothetical protein